MGKIIEGKKIPTFKADATNDSVFDIKNNKKNLVIYFYPKDNTPGCTTCLLYTSPSPRDGIGSRMPSSA